MAWKIKWTIRAQNDRKRIFEYWNDHNQSFTYTRKLNGLFTDALNLLQSHPYIGATTQVSGIRTKRVEKFVILYKITETEIVVMGIRDGRRKPLL